MAAGVVGVKLNVVAHTVGRVQPHHRMGGKPAPVDQALEHALAVGIHTHRFGAHHLVFQDVGEGTRQIPSLKKRRPVDVRGQLGQVEVFKHPASNEFGNGWGVVRPVDGGFVGAGLGQRPQRHLFFLGVLLAHPLVVSLKLGQILAGLIAQEVLRHAHAARGVGHIHHGSFVMRRNFDRRVHPAGGGPANQQRDFAHAKKLVFLHFGRHVLHFFEARGDEARQANQVGALHLGARQNFMAGHHDAHVDHLKVVALQHHGDNVFANVVHIALDGGNHNFALGLDVLTRRGLLALFFFYIGHEVGHGLLHDARTLDHLGQKHFACAKQVAHDVHARHQGAFNHVQGPTALGQHLLVRLFGVLGDEVGDAVHQRVA